MEGRKHENFNFYYIFLGCLVPLPTEEYQMQTPKRGSRILYGTRYSENISNGSSSKSVHSDVLRPRSGSPASRSVTPSFADTKNRRLSCPAPVARKLFAVSSPDLDAGNEASIDLLQMMLNCLIFKNQMVP